MATVLKGNDTICIKVLKHLRTGEGWFLSCSL